MCRSSSSISDVYCMSFMDGDSGTTGFVFCLIIMRVSPVRRDVDLVFRDIILRGSELVEVAVGSLDVLCKRDRELGSRMVWDDAECREAVFVQ